MVLLFILKVAADAPLLYTRPSVPLLEAVAEKDRMVLKFISIKPELKLVFNIRLTLPEVWFTLQEEKELELSIKFPTLAAPLKIP